MIVRIKKRTLKELLFGVALLALFLLAIIGVSFNSNPVNAVNITNTTVRTTVNVTNTEPNITYVFVDDLDSGNPTGDIDLVANGVKVVSCNASIFDYNGWQDINATSVNGTLYINSVGGGTADNNHRYVNTSCGSCRQGGSSTNASCDCRFALQYYANDSNQWRCNISVDDTGGTQKISSKIFLSDTEISQAYTITKLLAINTTLLINYGNLSVTETSSEIEHNVTNAGNINLNLTLRGFGGSQNGEDIMPGGGNTTMFCDFGNITHGYKRYAIGSSGFPFSDMKNLSNMTKRTNLTLPARINDINVDRDQNSTYWKLQVPLGVGGICNGTIIFGAIDAEI